MEFYKTFEARWADIDMNGHMRHTAYNDYAAQTRVMIFAKYNLGMDELAGFGVGPVLFREETLFKKEIRIGETFTVNAKIKCMSRNFRKWTIVHEIKAGEDLSAVITVDGAWLGLKSRRVEAPPQEMLDQVKDFPKADDFYWLD